MVGTESAFGAAEGLSMPVQLVTLGLVSMSWLARAAVVYLQWSDTLGQVRAGAGWRNDQASRLRG